MLMNSPKAATAVLLTLALCTTAVAQQAIEVSADGRTTIAIKPAPTDGQVIVNARGVPFGTAPDWENDLRMQVGGLQVADMNNDGRPDVVVGCYQSNSYPPYDDWRNLIYFNTGTSLENSPSWFSDDDRSTADIQVADLNNDTYLDIFASNGGYSLSPSAIYFGSAAGPATSPGWLSSEPNGAWTLSAAIFDVDHDNDLDLFTANQGYSTSDPYRPMFGFINNNGTLPTTPTWQSAETSIQNCLAVGDYDGDNWEDLAVSKWVNFETAVYRNLAGTLQTTPTWTTGDDDSDKGVAWADVDNNGWLDLALGHDPTLLYSNDNADLTLTWSATETYFGHSELRFCDVDRDGDPDLAETHFSNGHVRIYLNNAGTLSTTPSWVYDSPTVGTAIAFGDINGDNWPDLVVGNSGEPCVKVFYATPLWTTGDTNCDGYITFDDINPFVTAIVGREQYESEYPNCYWLTADCNNDSTVNFDDINPFIDLMTPEAQTAR